ncbi:uncharacterized protein TNCV_1127071 [Trichonephila clavipes]|nr:uncharacterized protein TNCV_1127071 [Trichonephila clavipes]
MTLSIAPLHGGSSVVLESNPMTRQLRPDGHGYELVSSVRALVPQKFSVEEELMHVKHVEVKSPHVGVMWKFGRGVISSDIEPTPTHIFDCPAILAALQEIGVLFSSTNLYMDNIEHISRTAIWAHGFTYQTLNFLWMYLDYPTVVNVYVTNPYEIVQPAITICSVNSYTRDFGDGPSNFEPWSSDGMTPELEPPLLTTTPHQWEDVSALDRFNVHRCPTRWVFSGTGLKLVTRQATIRYLYNSAIADTSGIRTQSQRHSSQRH